MISLTSPVKTRAHGWPAALKLAALCVTTVGLFYLQGPLAHALVLALVLSLYAAPGLVFFKAGVARLRVLWPFVLVVALWHGWTGALAEGAVIALRLVSAVALANLVTMTTRLTDMTAVLHRLGAPLRWLGVRTRVLDLAIALTIRLTPVLAEKGHLLSQAWRARSLRRPGWRIVLPFTVLALDDAEQVSEALRARGGVAGGGVAGDGGDIADRKG